MLLGFNALTCEAHVESSQVRSISSFISSIMGIFGESRLPRLLITNYPGADSKSFCLAPSINLRPGSLRKGNQESGWLGLRQDTLVEIVVGCVGVCVREREKEKEKERERHYMIPKITEWKMKNSQMFGFFLCMLLNIQIFANIHVLDGN